MSDKILIIDDDMDLIKLIETILKPDGYSVEWANTGLEGLKKAYASHPDLVILDIMMPDLDGFDTCYRLREMTNIPILMLTARTSETDVLRGLNAGADDYVKKPFSKSELEARIRALLRRGGDQVQSHPSYISRYTDDMLDIDLETHSITLHGKPLELSPTEYSLLACLVRQQGKVVPTRELLREVWSGPYANGVSMVALYIHYLRKKLKDQKPGHQYIHTLWGRGYWFAAKKDDRGSG